MSKASWGDAGPPEDVMMRVGRSGPENVKIIKNLWENITFYPLGPQGDRLDVSKIMKNE